MCSSNPPPAPDYAAAARAQGEANLQAALQTGMLSNPNITTPFGSRNVSYAQTGSGPEGMWTPSVTEQFSPTLQPAVTNLTNAVAQNYGTPYSTAGLPSPLNSQQTMQYYADNTRPVQSQLDLSSVPELQNSINMSGVQDVQGALDTSRLAPILNQADLSGVGRVQTGADLSGLPSIQMPNFSNIGQVQTGLNMSGAPGLKSEIDTSSMPDYQYNIANAGAIDRTFADVGGTQRNIEFDPLQPLRTSYDYSGLTALPGTDENTRKSIVQSIMGRYEPKLQQTEEAKRAELIARGFREGTEAYNREMDQQGQNRNDFYMAADIQGGQEMERLWNMGMGNRKQTWQEAMAQGDYENAAKLAQYEAGQKGAVTKGQFYNQAQGQDFAQAMQRGAFSNTAQQQQFGQNQQAAQFLNTTKGQAISDAIATGQFTNAARQQFFNEALQSGQFANEAQAQAFTQEVEKAVQMNAAQQQAYQQIMEPWAMTNTAQQQQYTQAMGAAGFQNTAQQQGYNQLLGAGQFANNAQAQQFGQAEDQMTAANAAQGQAFNQAEQAGLFENQAQNQEYTQTMGSMDYYNDYMTQQRNTQMQEELLQRNMPAMELNNMNSLLQFKPTAGATVQPTPIANATQQQGLYDLGVYNADVSGSNANTAALGTAAMAAAMFFSDRRLKSEVQRVGTHPLDIGIYSYRIFGRRSIGVMAQEVLRVKPEAVFQHPCGFLMVDYGAL